MLLLLQTLIVFVHVDSFINTFMGAVMAKRLRKEREDMLQDRLPILDKIYNTCVSNYPINSIIPRSADVFLDPFVQDLITCPPLSATFTDKNLAAVETTFPDIVLRWRKQAEEKLLNMVTQGCGIQTTSEFVLQLATTVFTCKYCIDDPLTYPRVLVHRCATRIFYSDREDEDMPSIRRFLDCAYWNIGNVITFEAQRTVVLTKAIKLCGLDPMSATREDIEKKWPIFECLACNDPRKGRCTLSWLGVVCCFLW